MDRGIIRCAHGEIDRHVDDPGAFRVVHAEKENIAPAAVSEVHAHRSRLAQDRKNRIACKKLCTEAEWIVVGVAGAEHPLIAAHTAYAASHLVG